MGASIQINGVTQRVASVPFGVPVSLTNAAAIGTSQKWEVLDYARDLDDAGPDFTTNFPAWTLAGDGSYFINQVPAYAAVTFKPDVTGAYWIRLTSVEPGGSVVQTAVIRVVEAHTGESLAAAGETTESGTAEGWKRIINGRMKRLGKRMQGYVRVANVSGSSIARGKVVRLAGTVDAHTVSPNVNPGGTAAAKAEKIFTIVVADNAAADADTLDYAILDQTLANNASGWAQKFGVFEAKTDVDFTTFVPGQALYLGTAGAMVSSSPPGAIVNLGCVLETSASQGTLAVQLAGSRPPATLVGGAHWTITSPRYYAVDPAGNNANVGFSDVSMAAAGTVAIQTLARLLEILPRHGQGRTVVIVLKTGTFSEGFRLVGYTGYARIIIRSTIDCSNTATDKINCSSVIALAGPGAGSAFVVNASPAPTSSTFSIASGTLTAEQALLGCRLRFTTGALAGQVGQIHANTSSAIVALDNFTGAPSAGDLFVIEDPGVIITGDIVIGGNNPGDALTAGVQVGGALTLVGISCGSSIVIGNEADVALSFVKGTSGLYPRRMQICWIATNYFDEGGTSRTTGAGHYGNGPVDVQDVVRAEVVAYQRNGTIGLRNNLSSRIFGFAKTLSTITNSGGTGPHVDTGFGVLIGPHGFQIGGRRNTRLSGITIEGSTVIMAGVDLESAASPITVRSSSIVYMTGVTGTLTGVPYGIQVTGQKNTLMMNFGGGTVNTVTGTAGDILVGGAVPVSHADLIITNVISSSGNHLIGTAGEIVGPGTTFTNVDGTQLSVGEIVRVSATGQVVRAQADTVAHATSGLWVSVTSPINNVFGLFVPLTTPQKWVLHDSAPTLNGLSYLFASTAGLASTTLVPQSGTNQKRRLGYVSKVSGSRGLVTGSPELLPVLSNGGV